MLISFIEFVMEFKELKRIMLLSVFNLGSGGVERIKIAFINVLRGY
jgi:hypothetical protein